jgi:hypothetical protein
LKDDQTVQEIIGKTTVTEDQTAKSDRTVRTQIRTGTSQTGRQTNTENQTTRKTPDKRKPGNITGIRKEADLNTTGSKNKSGLKLMNDVPNRKVVHL